MGTKGLLRWLATMSAVVAVAGCGNTQPKASSTPQDNTGADAGSNTTTASTDVTGLCQGSGCSIYGGKGDVWVGDGASVAYAGDGKYFFAVLAPGTTANPNDSAPDDLSDTTAAPWPAGSKNADGSSIPIGDSYLNRTFTVANGVISYVGNVAGGETPHDFANGKIRAMPYDDTTDAGGVYVLAICALVGEAPYPVDASTCKYDAFKIGAASPTAPVPLTITKDACGSLDDTFTWSIEKLVDRNFIEQSGGTATVTYTVVVTNTGDSLTGATVSGTITVFNANVDANGGTVPVAISGIADELSDGTICEVTGGGPQTLTEPKTTFAYRCTLPCPPQGEIDNVATVTWADQQLSTGAQLAAGDAAFTFTHVSFGKRTVDGCVAVTDTYAGELGTVCSTDPMPATFTYQRTLDVVPGACVEYPNTATFTTSDTCTTGSACQTVTVCGSCGHGSALTMGFWQNRNGQGIIEHHCGGTSGVSLRAFLTGFAPFQDLSATSCGGIASYVYDVVKAANAGGASMNAMLKAQDLATTLSTYFSDASLGGNAIGAGQPLGGVKIDLTNVSGEDVSSAFGGATSLTVLQLETYAASQSNAGGSLWYGNVKAVQQLAKDTFDAINNDAAFVAP